MTIVHYAFQGAAIEDLVEKSQKLLGKRRQINKPYSLLLRAPTGAGKTVMMATALDRVAKTTNQNIAFIWLAPYSLHKQSYESFVSSRATDSSLSSVLLEALDESSISPNTVAFVNWASISGDNKTLRKEQETGRSLAQVVAATRAEGTKVVVVVDESHHSLTGAQAQQVVHKVIDPDLVIEVTATPSFTGHDETVTVYRDEVIAENVIRPAIVINAEAGQGAALVDDMVVLSEPGTKEAILDAALARRQRLLEAYRQEGSPVRPLVLLQLPDAGQVPEDVREELEHHLLVKHNVSEANGRLAVWLSEDKANTGGIRDFHSSVEVLLFKQGIALGWDCPRAQVLVSLREMRSPSFTSQVLGRILRQPEHKLYENPELNNGYVFLNHESFSIKKEMDSIKARVTMSAVERPELPLQNHYRLAVDTGKKLKKDVIGAILRRVMADVPDLEHCGKVVAALLADERIEDIDSAQVVRGTAAGEAYGEAGLQKAIDNLVAELAQGTADQIKGKKYIYQGLLGAARELTELKDEAQLHEVLVHRDNRARVFSAARQAILEDIANATRKAMELTLREKWVPPKHRQVEMGNLAQDIVKCLYAPVYEGYFSNELEADFAQALGSNPKVSWWAKNGDSGSEHFGISVGKSKDASLFYPDWIVVYDDGSYGLYDTKAHSKGGSASTEDAKEKSNALARYLVEVKQAGLQVDGGLVVKDEARRWRVFRGASYAWTRELKSWDVLM